MTTVAVQPVLGASAARPSAGRAWGIVAMLGLAHCITDATTIYAAARLADPASLGYERAVWLIGAYNLLAFATQPLAGWFVDRLRAPASAAALGGAMAVASALLCTIAPMPALWLAGLGNSLFHVGAGSIVLQLARGNAAMPGVFVGPGSLGVVLGTYLGHGVWPGAVFAILACVLVTAWLPMLRGPIGRIEEPPPRPDAPRGRPLWLAIALLLIAYTIATRAHAGGSLASPWQGNVAVWVALALAGAVAKCVGGVLADRWGWITVAGLCALAAVPMVALAGRIAADAVDTAGLAQALVSGLIPSVVLIQATMPVTLAAAARILPGRPALAFGLCSASLMASGLPPWLVGWLAPALRAPAIQFTCLAALLAALMIVRGQHEKRSSAADSRMGRAYDLAKQ